MARGNGHRVLTARFTLTKHTTLSSGTFHQELEEGVLVRGPQGREGVGPV
jgi:hypothetical protein